MDHAQLLEQRLQQINFAECLLQQPADLAKCLKAKTTTQKRNQSTNWRKYQLSDKSMKLLATPNEIEGKREKGPGGVGEGRRRSSGCQSISAMLGEFLINGN
ncbi:uncharacterized protein LOC117791158 [Drosophila innubila]|uniref:uncharacterized protein LOC117791158 n=1 Tax=Drosophila innubila TaxID=198719 RepID=UPI00148B8F8A|nr:uncharacterized protein LOC117791158 [Drosophila innubila]